ncbi:MAG TPA: MFS transporter [Candidatus Dormibacteraeota bacterium]|jgi:MFS family permease|nr:MFS transporter [Candidatus Dormibacteraeota bacterium]
MTPATRGGPLWRRWDFNKLWAGQTASSVGSQITLVAGPLVAALTLHVTSVQMGLLRGAEVVPGVVVGLGAGAWADRARRRPLLIAADLVRGLALATIPVAALLGVLDLAQLFAVFIVTGAATTMFGAAYPAYLPTLVRRDDLVDANARLRLSSSAAQTAGPALGGALVQLVTGPLAIAVDACSFLASALSLAWIRIEEPAPSRPSGEGGGGSVIASIGEGLRYVAADPLPRAVAGTSAIFNLFDGVIFAVYVLYVTRDLHLDALALGLIFAACGVGGLAGALLARRLEARLTAGPTLICGIALATAGELLIPFAGGPEALAVSVLTLAEFAVGVGVTVWLINSVSLLQVHIPNSLQGRVNGTMGIAWSGLEALGAVVGGVLGQMAGLRAPLIVGAAGTSLALLWLVLSPVRSAHLE